MRFQTAPLLLAVALPGVLAAPQAGIASLSSCIQTAFLTIIQELKCDLTNTGCLCQQPKILDTIRSSISGKCGASDAQAAVAFGQLQCAAAGYNLAAPATVDAASATPTFSVTVTSSLMSAPPSISTTVPASIAPAWPTMTPGGNSTWNGTMISPSAFMGAADSVKMGGIAAGLLGVAIAFAML